MENKVVLEKSTHTHEMEGAEVIKDFENGVIQLKVDKGIVRHGEHGTIKTESPDVVKYVQQEVNPITKAMMNAFD